MTRLAGALLVALAGLMAGLLAAAGQREAARRGAALCRMLELMEFELTRFRTPLAELFDSLGARSEEPVSGLCGAVISAMERGETLSDAWDRGLSALSRRERERLAPLGRVLGRYGAEEQAAAVRDCRRSLEDQTAQLRTELRERSRIYIGLGAAGGVMLAVLLL